MGRKLDQKSMFHPVRVEILVIRDVILPIFWRCIKAFFNRKKRESGAKSTKL